MEDLTGQPVENQETTEQKLESGTEAIQTPEAVEPAPAEETIELRWGRDTRNANARTFNDLATQIGASPDAVKTWLQMGRDAARVYGEARQREQEAERRIEQRLAEERAKWEQQSRPAAPAKPRRSVADDPIAFWDEVAEKIGKLDSLDRLDRLEQMMERAVKQMDVERDQMTQMELQNEYVQEHGRFMKQQQAAGRPYVSAEELAETIDRYIKEAPEGTSMRDIIEAGYKIAAYDKVGSPAPKPQARPRPAPARVITGSPVNTSAEISEGGPRPNETLDERRARLHRQVGGVRVGDFTGALDS